MDTYRIREGVCLINVAGQNLLVADRNARKECPYIWEISPGSAFIWKKLVTETELKVLVDEYAEAFGIEAKIAGRNLMVFISKCRKYHYFMD